MYIKLQIQLINVLLNVKCQTINSYLVSYNMINYISSADRGAGGQSVTVKAAGNFTLVSSQSAALSSVTQHAMPSEFSVKGETKCLNSRFPLPTALCAGYSVKLILDFLYFKLSSSTSDHVLYDLFIHTLLVLRERV